MKKDSPFFEDMSRFASGAAGTLLDMKREIQSLVSSQCNEWLAASPLVTRAELDAVMAMAQKARSENAQLKAQLDELRLLVDSINKP